MSYIKPGDAIIRKKFGFWGNFYIHWGLYIRDTEPEIIEKQDIGVRQIAFGRFHKDMPYTVIPYTGDDPRELVIERALARADDKNFAALNDNCESFVKYCQTGKTPISRQITASLTLIAIGFLALLWAIIQIIW
jgi:hypothetical protein